MIDLFKKKKNVNKPGSTEVSEEEEEEESETEKSNDDDSEGWQIANSSKRRNKQMNIQANKKTKALITTVNEPSTSQNMFNLLENNDDQQNINNENNENAIPKPPPIFIPDVDDIKKMVESLKKVIKPEEFSYKSLRDGQVRLMLNSPDTYRTVVKHLEDTKKSFHTYQMKQERAYRVVVKNLHFSTPVASIKAELENLGHKVRNISNLRSRVTGLPLSMFFVDLEPNINNKEIYNEKYLFNAVVKIEPPLKNNDIVQCYRCQQFGHTKTYCRKLFKCVKCSLDHRTADCKKQLNTPPRCSNCSQEHTASYKGCEIYKKLLQKRNLLRRPNNNNQEAVFNLDDHNFPNMNRNNGTENIRRNNESNRNLYSQALRNDNNQHELLSNSIQRMEALFQQQMETVTSLINMMSKLLTKLCN